MKNIKIVSLFAASLLLLLVSMLGMILAAQGIVEDWDTIEIISSLAVTGISSYAIALLIIKILKSVENKIDN